MKKCKYCQSEIDEKAKYCPNCRKKQKRIPIWVWVIIGVVVIALFASGTDNEIEKTDSGNNNNQNSQNNGSNQNNNKEQSNSSQEKKKFKLGDDLTATNNDGKYRIKFISVKETNDRNKYSDIQAERVVIIEYEYENISLEEDLLISDFNFKLYDKNNNALESYPITVKDATKIGTGRKTTASEAYALNNPNNYIELEFYNNMFDSKSIGTIILEW